MSFEGTPESPLSASSASYQPPVHKGHWVRILVYLVLLCALGLIVWRIHQNQLQKAATADRPAGSGAGGSRRTETHAGLSYGAGHGNALDERDGEGASERGIAAGQVYRGPAGQAG